MLNRLGAFRLRVPLGRSGAGSWRVQYQQQESLSEAEDAVSVGRTKIKHAIS